MQHLHNMTGMFAALTDTHTDRGNYHSVHVIQIACVWVLLGSNARWRHRRRNNGTRGLMICSTVGRELCTGHLTTCVRIYYGNCTGLDFRSNCARRHRRLQCHTYKRSLDANTANAIGRAFFISVFTKARRYDEYMRTNIAYRRIEARCARNFQRTQL